MPRSLQIPFIERAPGWMKASATFVFGAILFIALYLSVQDYRTSVLGYQLLPSQKVDPETTAALVGALPQLFQIALAWVVASRARGRRLALLLWLIAFAFDFASDYYFKIEGVAWPSEFVPHAILAFSIVGETFVLYTFGSEFMLLFAWSNLSPLLLPGIQARLRRWRQSLQHGVQQATAGAGNEIGGLFNVPAAHDPGPGGGYSALPHDDPLFLPEDSRQPYEPLPDALERLRR